VIDLCESINELAYLIEALSAEERKKRRRRKELALTLAALLAGRPSQFSTFNKATPAEVKRRKALVRRVTVAAFRTVGPRGGLSDPTPIHPGDDLWATAINPDELTTRSGFQFGSNDKRFTPGEGWIISRAVSPFPFGVAGGALLPGKKEEIPIIAYEKMWMTDFHPCPVCDENALKGWIPADEAFPSGDMEPTAHPNCRCNVWFRRFDQTLV